MRKWEGGEGGREEGRERTKEGGRKEEGGGQEAGDHELDEGGHFPYLQLM